MVREIKVSNIADVETIATVAARCTDDVGLHDGKGQIADAKSILGLMSLDFTQPVMVVSEDAAALERVCEAIS